MRRVLLLPLLVLAGLAAAALAVVAATSRSARDDVERRVREVRRASALAFRLAHLGAEEERDVLALRVEPTSERSARIAAATEEMDAIARELGALDLSARGRALWNEVIAARAAMARERGAVIDAVRSGDDRAIALAYARWELAIGRTNPIVADLAVFSMRRLEGAIVEVQRIRARAIGLLVAVLGASAVIILAFSLFVDRHLVRPVRAMTDAARRIARERVALAVPGGHRRDELGVLARAVTRTAGNLVRANVELERSVVARDDFLSIASHELKTPLTALKLQLQNGVRRWGEQNAGKPVPPWAGAALRQIDRLEVLVGNLLDLARIRSGRLVLRCAPADLAELARAVAERLRDVLAREGNTLEIDLPERLELACDGARVEQVLGNLLANAAQHAPGSRVALRACREGERAVLSVDDDGPGIPESARERVFAPYAKEEGRRVTGGLGLGLHIARQIVEAHGGTIHATGGPRGGALVVVELPAAESRSRDRGGGAAAGRGSDAPP